MTVDVQCPYCDGTGTDAHDGAVCLYCLGQRHIAVDRLADGTVPPTYREWILDLSRPRHASSE
jgi:DnaJ-class molecular chaperone